MKVYYPYDLKIMGKNIKMLLMEPDTKKTVYWIVKPAVNVPGGSIVNIPVDIVSSRNAYSSTNFYVEHEAQIYGYEKLKKEVEKKIRSVL